MSARVFNNTKPPNRGYVKPQVQVDAKILADISESGQKNIVSSLVIPKNEASVWKVMKGQTCRFICSYGSQVGDVNVWNLENTKERFYSGKSRQIHRGHISIGDSMWSNFPYLRPLATISADSLAGYGLDKEGFGVHDILGTRCDQYMQKLMTGKCDVHTCHDNLTKAVKEFGLTEDDVHDVFNIFMCTAYKDDEYWIRGSPAETGDYIELFARRDLLVACSACPVGDVSVACGAPIPEDLPKPLDVVIGQPDAKLVEAFFAQYKD